MKIIGYKDIDRAIHSNNELVDDFKKIKEQFIRKYSIEKDILIYLLDSELSCISSAIGGNVKGKSFLDLGCGSTSYGEHVGYDNHMNISDGKKNRDFEPWIPRALHELGVHVIGIDIGSLDREEFEHYSLDLLKENALSVIPDHSIDHVYSKLLYSSPQLANMVSSRYYPDIASKVKDKAIPYWTIGDGERLAKTVLEQKLFHQIERVLKPAGTYLRFEV